MVRNLQDPIGESTTFLDFQSRLSEVAKIDRPVLIIGERGTGKEMAARRLHYLSPRWEQPLITMNCAALSPSLIEDELFGHEAGAFTGATQKRQGRFEAADEGTLFLDEIGQTPAEVQSKILRVVEYNAFERVGSSQTISVDVRIIGATNSDLLEMANAGKFKSDLLDRLSFEVLFIPPLRVREGDILVLANHFASRMAFEIGESEIPRFSVKVMDALMDYDWPGNVRELKNVVERAVYRSRGKLVKEIDLKPFEYPYGDLAETEQPNTKELPKVTDPMDALAQGVGERPFKEIIQEVEVTLLKEALDRCASNQRKAAEMLGLTYHQWRGHYRKYEEMLIAD